ncbi:MAG: hypothetical protein GY696_03455, partial [Gammaproteobacteria bacterium]|nr:hypothetical protein [Gammaproteobacteria bacterium]
VEGGGGGGVGGGGGGGGGGRQDLSDSTKQLMLYFNPLGLQTMWVYDPEAEKMVSREITFVPGLYKIFDEILVNAADNKQRDPSMNLIKVNIDP